MSTEQNKTIARRYLEQVWNEGNLPLVDELFTSDSLVFDPGTPGRQGGVEGEKQAASLYRMAFPDIHFSLEDVIAEGDRVVVRWNSNGTHLGDLMGLPPSGRSVNISGISILRLVNGRIVEHWLNWDALGMMRQLGLIPDQA